MKIAEEQYEQTACEACGQQTRLTLVPERHECDGCGAVLDSVVGWLSVNVFQRPTAAQGCDPDELEFCSWRCALGRLRTVECDDFVSLPLLLFRDAPPGQDIAGFLAQLKTTGEE